MSNIFNGQKTVTAAGTAELLLTTDLDIYVVTIKAKSTNTGLIYVGDGDVDSTHGFILGAGEEVSIFVDTDDTNPYIDSSINGEGVSYIGWLNEGRSRR